MRQLFDLRSALALGACFAAACASADVATVELPTALGGGSSTTEHPRPSPVGHLPRHGYGTPYTAPLTSGGDPVPDVALSASADISSQAPMAGDQGQTDSCTTWSTAYSALGWWATHEGYSGITLAPMYLYGQIAQGNCSVESTPEYVLSMIQQQGVDTWTDFEPMQYDLDCGAQPTTAETNNAARFKITGYMRSNLSGGVQKAIESTIVDGRPALLSINVYPEFDNASSTSYLVGAPVQGDALSGGHEIAAFAYDANGVWILNSWGTDWGRNGWAELSWDFVNGSFGGKANVYDVTSITGVDFNISDDNSSCALWAFTAQCQDNPSYMLSNCSLSCANPWPTFSSPATWFHIQNVALGSSYSLDTGVIAATGNYSGQYWELTPLGSGYYRLTNSYQGSATSFDTLQMAATGNYSGQYWLLEPITDGLYRMTNAYLGTGTSLTVNTSTLALESDPTIEDDSQYWQIFLAD
jgi:hypothetical protein